MKKGSSGRLQKLHQNNQNLLQAIRDSGEDKSEVALDVAASMFVFTHPLKQKGDSFALSLLFNFKNLAVDKGLMKMLAFWFLEGTKRISNVF